MKRHLYFYYWLAAVIMVMCSTATISAQVKVTSLSQLKAGSVIKIYPKDNNGTSHYGESNKALACSGNGKDLTSYERAGSGDSWTLVDAGDGYYYLKNNLGCYWAYQSKSSFTSLTCTASQSSAVKVSLTWDSTYGGVCFWNEQDGTGLNNLNGFGYRFNWWSLQSDYNSSDANTTFDVAILQEGSGEPVNTLVQKTINGLRYLLNLRSKTAKVLGTEPNRYFVAAVIPQSVRYNGNDYVVTSLGDHCFSRCGDLTSITLPNSITSLGTNCFNGCASLTSITLPDGITSLGDCCFSGCASLTSITLPDGITSLGGGCFYDCAALTSITLPNSITSLGANCFKGCAALTSITLPDGITSLGYGCFFGCTGLTSITLPDGITSLENNCFASCRSLEKISLPSTLKVIGEEVLKDVSNNITIYCFAQTPPVNISYDFVNSKCRLFVPRGSMEKYKNTYPWSNAYDNIDPLYLVESIAVPSDVSVGKTETTNLEYTVLPDDVENKKVIWSSKNPDIASVDETSGVITANKMGDAVITATATDGSGISASTTIHVTPLKVSHIGITKEMSLLRTTTGQIETTFEPELADIKTLKWTSDNENIATVTQEGVVKGVNVGTANITATTTDGSNVSATCKVTVMPITINLSTKTINLQQGATYSEQEVKVLPDNYEHKEVSWSSSDPSVASIDANGKIKANKPGIATIRYVLDRDNNIYADCKIIVYAPSVVYVGGLYYLLDGKSNTATVTGIYGANGNGLDASRVAQYYSGTINIPRSVTYNGITYDVTNVGSYSFACQNDLQSIFIPTSVKTVERSASTKAEKLQMVNVEEESQLVNIGENAFKECTGLRFFTFEGTTMKMKSIDASAFYGCSKLERVKWVGKSTLMTIGDYAFYKCISLNNFAMPNSVLSVGNYSFRYCAGLTNVSLSSTLSIIYEYAFGECGFSHITLPESLVSVQAGSFINNQYLEDITFPARMEGIGSAAFENNVSLGTVTFKTEINTMTIGDNAFNLCPALSKVNIEHLDSWAHTNFKNAKANPANTSHNIYMNGVEIIDVVLPTGTRYVNNNAFNGCSHIKSLSMPATIDRINDNIIYGCSNLKDVYCYATEVPPFIGTQDPAEMDDVFKAATLHVIYGNENAYKADSWWGRFAQVAGCNAPAPDLIKVESITISQTEATLKPDDTIQLTATVYPTNADNKKINWKSSNENVAMVTDEGFVLALAEGTSDIIAEAVDGSGIKAVCKITVEKKPSSDVKLSLIEFVNSAVTIEQGKSVLLGVNYYPENATNKQLAWTSARTGVATVDDKGVVTAVGEGKSIITAKSTDGTDLSINCVVTVTPATGIGNITMGDVKLVIKDRHLKVEGLVDNDVVQIINTIGFTVYKGTEHEIDLKAAGVYIMKVKGKTLKFSVK